ncbi:DUF1294 domain-containing protein [Segatella copri]|uniref:DUF1294 domain-containing protein n=1 Tax=Segatella copri TaxID=165179 RepID=UPI003F960283
MGFQLQRYKKYRRLPTFLGTISYPELRYGIDKDKAKKAKWRISEATLLTMAAVGGSIGAWLGMKAWHHKTQHRKFKYGVPIILLIQIALMIYFHLNH